MTIWTLRQVLDRMHLNHISVVLVCLPAPMLQDLEMECLNPHSMALQEIGLCFPKIHILPSRLDVRLILILIPLQLLHELTRSRHDMFEEYTRRQFLAKAPEKNPFGDEEQPVKFADFDAFKKVGSELSTQAVAPIPITDGIPAQIRVLQQMTQLIMMSPERLRDKTEEQKDMEQTNWVGSCSSNTHFRAFTYDLVAED